MANLMAECRTNYFRVTDEERYAELFGKLCAEDDIHDFTCTDDDGQFYHGFGTYDDITYMDDDENVVAIHKFCEEVAKILPDNEALIFIETYHEKLRCVNGFYVVATKAGVETGDLTNTAVETAGRLLGDPEWKTQLIY